LLEKVDLMNLLFDFYGQLLTDRQKDFMELYYAQNLSLGEIAEEFNVSRQAVYDTLKRSGQLLTQYEEKLGLASRFKAERNKLSAAAALLDESGSIQTNGKVRRAREIIDEILEL
jgi:predicted DNA-binding protein YlxM (UPF0122 family)